MEPREKWTQSEISHGDNGYHCRCVYVLNTKWSPRFELLSWQLAIVNHALLRFQFELIPMMKMVLMVVCSSMRWTWNKVQGEKRILVVDNNKSSLNCLLKNKKKKPKRPAVFNIFQLTSKLWTWSNNWWQWFNLLTQWTDKTIIK